MKEHINRTSANVLKQMESYISLKYYIDIPLHYHDWPVSADIALYMLKEIEKNDYNLILEFGSGTSTVLFANMAKQKQNNNGEVVDVVSFEHSSEYRDLTKKELNFYNLDHFADVQYTPLEDFNYNDSNFKYYSCKSIFEKLSEKNQYNKIFVLVDGPPEFTGKLARFPAMVYLLEFFSDKEIHIILDDFNRQDEKDIVYKWEKLLNSKSLKYTKQIVKSEKGLCYIKINERGKES